MMIPDKFSQSLHNLNSTITAWKKLADVDPNKEFQVDSQDRISTSWLGRTFTKTQGRILGPQDKKSREIWAINMESKTRGQVEELVLALQNTTHPEDFKVAREALEMLEKNLYHIKKFRGADAAIDEEEILRYASLQTEINEAKTTLLRKIEATSSLILSEQAASQMHLTLKTLSLPAAKSDVQDMLLGKGLNLTAVEVQPGIAVPHQFNVDLNRLRSLTLQGKALALPKGDHDAPAKVRVYEQLKQALGNDETSTQRVLSLLTQAHAASLNQMGLSAFNPEAKSEQGMPPVYKTWIGSSGLHLSADVDKNSVYLTVKTCMFPKIIEDHNPESLQSIMLKRVIEIPKVELANPSNATCPGMNVTETRSSFLPKQMAEKMIERF